MLKSLSLLALAGTASAVSVMDHKTPDAHFDKMFEQVDAIKANIDTWTQEQAAGVHQVITDVLEKYHAEHVALLEVSASEAGAGASVANEDAANLVEQDGSEDAAKAKAILADEESKPPNSVSLWKRLFNCAKCGMDDGTVGIMSADKKVGEAIDATANAAAETSAAAADMKIERAYALEWVLAPVPELLPNPMVTFICDPKAGNMLFDKENADAATKEPVDPENKEAIEGYTSEIEETKAVAEGEAAASAEKSDAVAKSEGSGQSLFKKVMKSIISGMVKFGNKVLEAMKAIAQLLFTTVRCAICVFCNLINMIVDLIAYIKKKAMAALTFLSDAGAKFIGSISTGFSNWKKNREVELQRRDDRVKAAESGTLGNLGDYCRENKHCVSDNCETSVVTRNSCEASLKQPEYRKDHCNGVGQCALEDTCKSYGCQWTGGKLSKMFGFSATCQCKMPKKIVAPTGPLRLDEGVEDSTVPVHKGSLAELSASTGLRSNQKAAAAANAASPATPTGLVDVSDLALERDDPKLAHLERQDMGHPSQDIHTLTHKQRMARAAYNLHSAGAFDNHDQFLDDHLYTAHNAHQVLSSTVSLMQLSARAHESAESRAAASAMGLVKLPNRCVGAEQIGKTITLAINYENPALFSCLMAMPFALKDCMPELLVAISPIAIEGNKISEVCMAGKVAAEDAGKDVSKQELNEMQEAGMEKALMEKAPSGELGDKVKAL